MTTITEKEPILQRIFSFASITIIIVFALLLLGFSAGAMYSIYKTPSNDFAEIGFYMNQRGELLYEGLERPENGEDVTSVFVKSLVYLPNGGNYDKALRKIQAQDGFPAKLKPVNDLVYHWLWATATIRVIYQDGEFKSVFEGANPDYCEGAHYAICK